MLNGTPGSLMRPTGNQPSFTEKSMMISMPDQKVGIEYAIMPMLVEATSNLLLRFQPAKTPAMSPTIVARIVPVPTRMTVGQMRSWTTSATARFSLNDSPNLNAAVSFQ